MLPHDQDMRDLTALVNEEFFQCLVSRELLRYPVKTCIADGV